MHAILALNHMMPLTDVSCFHLILLFLHLQNDCYRLQIGQHDLSNEKYALIIVNRKLYLINRRIELTVPRQILLIYVIRKLHEKGDTLANFPYCLGL